MKFLKINLPSHEVPQIDQQVNLPTLKIRQVKYLREGWGKELG